VTTWQHWTKMQLYFWVTVCKTVHPMLSDRCLSVVCHLCVCLSNIRALCPNGWMDQDATWHEGRSQLKWLCVIWGPSPPAHKGDEDPLQCSTHFYCGQTARCINMPLAMEIGLSPEDFILHGEPSLSALPKQGQHPLTGQCAANFSLQRTCFQWGLVLLLSDIKGTEVPRANILIPHERQLIALQLCCWQYLILILRTSGVA